MEKVTLQPSKGFTHLKPKIVTGDKAQWPAIEGGSNLTSFHGIGELRKAGYDVSKLTHAVVCEM